MLTVYAIEPPATQLLYWNGKLVLDSPGRAYYHVYSKLLAMCIGSLAFARCECACIAGDVRTPPTVALVAADAFAQPSSLDKGSKEDQLANEGADAITSCAVRNMDVCYGCHRLIVPWVIRLGDDIP